MPSNNADEIVPRLWLGNVRASVDEGFLHDRNIQVVFNCTKNLPFSYMVPIRYRIPVDDNLQEEEIRNMALWSVEIAHKIMSEYNKGKTILVHCMAGMQRSAAAVAFFLIANNRMKMEDAMAYIRQRRPIAFTPGANFEDSIRYFMKEWQTNILPHVRYM
jgi:rhodanese-related sulfurtransferase